MRKAGCDWLGRYLLIIVGFKDEDHDEEERGKEDSRKTEKRAPKSLFNTSTSKREFGRFKI